MAKIVLDVQTDIPLIAFCHAKCFPSLAFSEETIIQEEKAHRAICFEVNEGHLDEAGFSMWLYLEEDIPADILAFYAQAGEPVIDEGVCFLPIHQQPFTVEQGNMALTGFQLADGKYYIDKDGIEYVGDANYTVASREECTIPPGQYLISAYPLGDFSDEQYERLNKENKESIKQQFISAFGEEKYYSFMKYKDGNVLKGCLMGILLPGVVVMMFLLSSLFIDMSRNVLISVMVVLMIIWGILYNVSVVTRNKNDEKFKFYQNKYDELEDQCHDHYAVNIVATLRRLSD